MKLLKSLFANNKKPSKVDITVEITTQCKKRTRNKLKYRKKPLEVEALQWNGKNINEVRAFAGSSVTGDFFGDNSSLRIVNENRKKDEEYISFDRFTFVKVNVGDYIVKDIDGKYHAVEAEVFEMGYELV